MHRLQQIQMAWHLGHPLSQTIFTSLYIEALLSSRTDKLDSVNFGRNAFSANDEPLTRQILRAYCLGLIKTCCFVNNRIKSEHFYEVSYETRASIDYFPA